jgi:hypothetical protein
MTQRKMAHSATRFLWLAISVLILHPAAWATTYFVSPGGNDANPGTEAKPWRTLLKVSQARFSAGDQILLEGGRTFEGTLTLDERSSSNPENPIVIGSYGQGRAMIRAGPGTGILVRNIGGVVIRGLELIGGGFASNGGFGVEVVNQRGNTRLDRVWLESLEASGFRWAGIYVGGEPDLPRPLPAGELPRPGRDGFRNVKISRCVAHDNIYYGIFVSGPWWQYKSGFANEYVSITDCIAHDNPGDPNYKKNHSGNGILLDDTDGGLIERCTAYQNGAANGSQEGGPVGIWADESNRVIIQFCESYDNRTGGLADGGGFDLDGGVTNSIAQYNYSHGNDGAGYLVWNYGGAVHPLERNTIRYNISVNDGRKHHYGGIFLGTSGGAVHGVEAYNNTVFMTSSETAQPVAVWVGGGQPNTDIHLRNNLLISDGHVPLVEVEPNQTDVLFQGNAYWAGQGSFTVVWKGKTYDSLAAWQAGAGQERLRGKPRGMVVDPGVSSVGATETMAGKRPLSELTSYRLLPGSPLIDAGIDLAAEFGLDVGTQDFWGTPIPQGKGFDIGACELGAGH